MTTPNCNTRDETRTRKTQRSGDFESDVGPQTASATDRLPALPTHGDAPTCIQSAPLSATRKRCPRCDTVRPIDAFGSRVVRGTRYPSPYCRDCRCHYERDQYRTSPAHRAKIAARDRALRARYPEHFAARRAVQSALGSGRLTRQPCEVGTGCRGKVQAHHDDYTRPLDVRWLCQGHHRAADLALLKRSAA